MNIHNPKTATKSTNSAIESQQLALANMWSNVNISTINTSVDICLDPFIVLQLCSVHLLPRPKDQETISTSVYHWNKGCHISRSIGKLVECFCRDTRTGTDKPRWPLLCDRCSVCTQGISSRLCWEGKMCRIVVDEWKSYIMRNRPNRASAETRTFERWWRWL